MNWEKIMIFTFLLRSYSLGHFSTTNTKKRIWEKLTKVKDLDVPKKVEQIKQDTYDRQNKRTQHQMRYFRHEKKENLRN